MGIGLVHLRQSRRGARERAAPPYWGASLRVGRFLPGAPDKMALNQSRRVENGLTRREQGYGHRNREKGGSMIGAGGLVVSIIGFAVGAILDWAVTEPYQHGFNVNKVGWILMIVGVVGAVVSIIVMVAGNTRRRRTVVDDGQGNLVRRVDSTY
jgi:hypothetical protein